MHKDKKEGNNNKLNANLFTQFLRRAYGPGPKASVSQFGGERSFVYCSSILNPGVKDFF